jgi:DNA-binding response OmpR family regulator
MSGSWAVVTPWARHLHPFARCILKRRILLVDDDLAVLLTLKAVLEFHGFEVDTAKSSAEAFVRMSSSVYHMVISDLRMETEEAGLEVIRNARRQTYAPAIALLTAYPPSVGQQREGEDWTGADSGSILIKPLETASLIKQLESLLDSHATRRKIKPKADSAHGILHAS